MAFYMLDWLTHCWETEMKWLKLSAGIVSKLIRTSSWTKMWPLCCLRLRSWSFSFCRTWAPFRGSAKNMAAVADRLTDPLRQGYMLAYIRAVRHEMSWTTIITIIRSAIDQVNNRPWRKAYGAGLWLPEARVEPWVDRTDHPHKLRFPLEWIPHLLHQFQNHFGLQCHCFVVSGSMHFVRRRRRQAQRT